MKRLFIAVPVSIMLFCMVSVANGGKMSIPITLELSNGKQIEAELEQTEDHLNIKDTSLGGITIGMDKIKEIILLGRFCGGLPCFYRLTVVLSNGEKLEGLSHGKYIGTLRSDYYGRITIETYPVHIYLGGKPAE